MKLTSLLLALCIFMQPLGPSIAIAQDSDTPVESCESGWAWDASKGQCQMTDESIAARDGAKKM